MIVCPDCMATFESTELGRLSYDSHTCDPTEADR